MKKWIFLVAAFMLVSSSLVLTLEAQAKDPAAASIRVMFVEEGTNYQWEYASPSRYKYGEEEHVITGNKAKDKVNEIVDLLKVDEEEKVDDLLKRAQQRYPNLIRMDIRFINEEGELFTWVWNS
ncbi:hypothetical protein [Bacillus suaedae]|uniref:Uncharacterized protein n=1 Tax=Halalkalibacter suaedae TaxID=2822140 RepID=A0A940WNK5_9BACI|nr:hypothetical protein [Bacillus suaedae]MBP3949759.1 hypothetical protein [Bacillus suaedae]